MAKRKASKAVDNWKKKKWFPIVAPKLFRETQIGETITDDPANLIGKSIKQNMMALIGDIKRKDTEIGFRIIDYKDQKALTEVVKYEILPSAIKRKVRRSKDRLDESLLAKTNDGKIVRLKPFLLTINNTKSSIQKDLRHTLVNEIITYVNKTNYEALLSEVVAHRFQRNLLETLKKIYPLKICEIRKLELVNDDGKKKHFASMVTIKKKKVTEDVEEESNDAEPEEKEKKEE